MQRPKHLTHFVLSVLLVLLCILSFWWLDSNLVRFLGGNCSNFLLSAFSNKGSLHAELPTDLSGEPSRCKTNSIILYLFNFHRIGPLGRFGLVVEMSIGIYIGMSPSHAIFFEASHWPTGHMTRSQASHWSEKKCSQLNNF